MRFLVVLLAVLSFPLLAVAGEKGKLVGLLADYADLKQRVQEIQSARKDGYSSDTKEMVALMNEIQAAHQDAQTFHAQLKPRREDKSHAVPLALSYAYNAMHQLIATEIDRNLYKSGLAATLSAKYADIWQTIDPSIPVVSAP